MQSVLHHYKLTRFSNNTSTRQKKGCVLHHYKLTRFSNDLKTIKLFEKFYTITNLQGSQTSNEIITEPNISVNMRKPPSNV